MFLFGGLFYWETNWELLSLVFPVFMIFVYHDRPQSEKSGESNYNKYPIDIILDCIRKCGEQCCSKENA